MSAAPDTPQAAFARFVRRACDDAKNTRGWSVTDLAAHTGVGRSTVFRWLAGDWHDYPELAKVRGFCTALDVPVTAAFRALGLPDGAPAAGAAGAGAASAPGTGAASSSASAPGTGAASGAGTGRIDARTSADLQVIMSRLTDPAVSAEEKRVIRDLLRYLAQRPVRRAG